MKKLFVIQKYVVASSIVEALKLERKIKPDECWLDEDFKKACKPEITKGGKGMGFNSSSKKKKNEEP
jgi:hypothetical protein